MVSPLNPFNWFQKKNNPPLQRKGFAQILQATMDALLDGRAKKPANFTEQGYNSNPIVYRCIEERAKGVSGLDLEIHKDTTVNGKTQKQVIDNHPILALLDAPNPFQTRKELIKQLVINLDTTGTAFLLAIRDGKGTPIELNILPSIDMTITEGKNLYPISYIYKKDTPDQKTYPIDQLTGACDVLCIKFPNPANPQLGLAPLSPGWSAADTFNQGMNYNNSLLRNGGRPSGILSTTGELTEEQYRKLKEHLTEDWQGSENAGIIPILEGGLEWTETSKSPKDMDFLQGMDATAMYIASVYGVPFPLVIPSSATFSNIKDSRISLYENTVIPLAEDILEPLGNWLIGMFKQGSRSQKSPDYDNICLTFDPEKIRALEERRNEKADRVAKLLDAGILTPNEAREQLGFSTINDPEADKLAPLGNIPQASTSSELVPRNEELG